MTAPGSREQIARLIDRVARLDGAPDRGAAGGEWFYVDLAALVVQAVTDAATAAARVAAVDGYEAGRRDGPAVGYQAGWHAALPPVAALGSERR